MANDWQFDDEDQNQNNNNGKDPLRAHVKALEKERKELADRLAKAEAQARTSALKDVLTENKANPKLAALIPATVEPTTDAVKAWLDEYKDLFTLSQNVAQDAGNAGDGDNVHQGADVDAENEALVQAQNAALRMAQATTGGMAPSSKPGELLNKVLDPALKPEDLLKMIQQAGGGYGSG